MAYELLKKNLPYDIALKIHNMKKENTQCLSCKICNETVLSLKKYQIIPFKEKIYWWIQNNTLNTELGRTFAIEENVKENMKKIGGNSGYIELYKNTKIYHETSNQIFNITAELYEMENNYFWNNNNVHCYDCTIRKYKLKIGFHNLYINSKIRRN